MRPIKLKMSAFGPYAGEVVIPMDELGQQGLYLITGDTGAGKTTIFDAICFALYGQASGQNREVSMFRSKYADADMPTEVELVFSHAGKEYTVKRNPEYFRPAKRGEGLKKQLAGAELHMPDGQVVSKVREVTVAIEGLLGINHDQFSQIAMLSQGEFLKLLFASTEDRKVIFRQLFNTRLYDDFQNKLNSEATSLDRICKGAKASLNQYVSDIMVASDDVLSIEVDKAKARRLTTEEIIYLLDRLIKQDSDLYDKNGAELINIDSDLEKVNQALGVSEGVENAKNELAKALSKLEQEKPKAEELQEKYDEANKALKGKDKFLEDAAKIEEELPKYDKLDELNGSIASLGTEIKRAAAKIEKQNAATEEKKSSLEKHKQELSKLGEAGANKEKLSAQKQRLKESLKELKELEEKLEEHKKKCAELEKAQTAYAREDTEFKKLQYKYEVLDQAFRDGQAGILAASLKEGDKCPVCGSTTHPSPAHLTDDVPTKQDLDNAKANAEKARKIANATSIKAGSLKGELESFEKSLKAELVKQVKSDKLEEAAKLVSAYVADKESKLEAVKEQIALEQKNIDRKVKLEKMIPDEESEIKKIEEEIGLLKNKKSAHEASLKEKTRQAADITKGLTFEKSSDAKDKILELKKSAEALQKAFNTISDKCKKCNKTIDELKGQITGYQNTIESAREVDLDALKTQKQELSNRRKEIIDTNQTLNARKKRNEDIRSNILKKSGELAEQEKKLQWLMGLSDTANGKLSGKEKIKLEAYIQTTYFDRIINRANLRLMKMSGGQYELKRTEEASNSKSQSGLDLSVIDHYNGSERSVKTLSGGESFMASLSLALGMSDEVQSNAGGIQVDTLFVDEGFGSLDSDALEQAYSALAGLTEGNRLVGIISHVADLKEKIDCQIVVTKMKTGGSTATLCI